MDCGGGYSAGQDVEDTIMEWETKGEATDCTMLTIHVVGLGGKEFDVHVAKNGSIIDVKWRIQQEHGSDAKEMQLILGSEVLDDMAVLSNTSAKDDGLTLVMRRGTMELHVSVSDDTQWHGQHKFALRSEVLKSAVEKIEVSVRNFQDQGWGGCQARLFIYLHDPANEDALVTSMKVFGPLRTGEYDENKHRRSPSCTIGPEEPVVALAKPGMVYKLKYQCGGGGGHSITVTDWRCKIFPQNWSTDDATTKVSGQVSLSHTSRLGGDRSTGLWELEEPPY